MNTVYLNIDTTKLTHISKVFTTNAYVVMCKHSDSALAFELQPEESYIYLRDLDDMDVNQVDNLHTAKDVAEFLLAHYKEPSSLIEFLDGACYLWEFTDSHNCKTFGIYEVIAELS